MMLKGHTYKTFKTAPGTPECREACLADVRPEDFVKNKDRYYMAKGPKRGDRKCKRSITVKEGGGVGRGQGGKEGEGGNIQLIARYASAT